MSKIATFAIIFISLLSHSAVAQNPENGPKFNLLPLRTLNLNAETRVRLSNEITMEMAVLRDRLLTAAKKLSTYVNQPANNNRRMSSKVWSSNQSPLLQDSERPLTIEPVWCKLLNNDVMFLQIVDRDYGTLLSSRHLIFNDTDKKPYSDRIENLRQSLPGIAERLLNQLPLKGNAPKDNALLLQIQSRRLSNWKSLAPPECVAMLIEEKLYPDFEVSRSGGLQFVQHIRQSLGELTGLRRPTRNLQLSWQDLELSERNPLQLKVRINQSEGPFGQPYPSLGEHNLQLGWDDTGFTLTLPVALQEHLKEQRDQLLFKDQPQVVHLYGAWAYLDKGRSWGLKMRDRLIAIEAPDDIKGHVVRYFGAEAKLKDKQGRLINEGAIVYIRKGQDKVKVGHQLWFDPKKYPAEWR